MRTERFIYGCFSERAIPIELQLQSLASEPNNVMNVVYALDFGFDITVPPAAKVADITAMRPTSSEEPSE